MDDFSLDSYDYDLPEDRIAQRPPAERGASRLMVLERALDPSAPRPAFPAFPPINPIDTWFSSLPEYLPPGALLVANNSRVAPARLLGKRPSGGKAELLLLTPPPLLEREARPAPFPGGREAVAEALLKPGRSIRPGDELAFGPPDFPGNSPHIRATVLEKGEFGRHTVLLSWQGGLDAALEAAGRIPLPPYIKREQDAGDLDRYQTLHSRPDKAGSVAAPTAGLHFTPEMRASLAKRGFGWAEVTLHVGYGTFSPVREGDIRAHAMHAEYVEVPAKTAQAVREAKREGRPVIAVGTTSARSLEGMALALGGERAGDSPGDPAVDFPEDGWQGWTNIFIYPGFRFRVVDGLLTNFHLPKSSLLMLVSALVGRENVLDAYAQAMRKNYRFFSYGDAMLIR